MIRIVGALIVLAAYASVCIRAAIRCGEPHPHRGKRPESRPPHADCPSDGLHRDPRRGRRRGRRGCQRQRARHARNGSAEPRESRAAGARDRAVGRQRVWALGCGRRGQVPRREARRLLHRSGRGPDRARGDSVRPAGRRRDHSPRTGLRICGRARRDREPGGRRQRRGRRGRDGRQAVAIGSGDEGRPRAAPRSNCQVDSWLRRWSRSTRWAMLWIRRRASSSRVGGPKMEAGSPICARCCG